MVRKLALAAVIAGTFAVSACNTVDGAKKDVNSASKAVEKGTDGK